jgi:hypothetical protein
MKQMKFVPADRLYRLAGWLLPVMALLLFSCQKGDNPVPHPPASDFVKVAEELHGQVYSGVIEVYQEDDGIVFSCNDGKLLVALQKLNADKLPVSGNIEHGEIICSSAGIVFRNPASNDVWTYVNNDPESIKEFEKVVSQFKNLTQSLIEGHIRINNLLS